jgi:hypothetical protein
LIEEDSNCKKVTVSSDKSHAESIETDNKKKFKHVKFVLEMDGIRSVVIATLPQSQLPMARALMEEEIKSRFEGPVTEFGESRYTEKGKGGLLTGRYLNK